MQLAAQGATVIVHGRDATRGGAVVAEIENAGGSARFVAADLGEPAEALRLAEQVGDVDILVNNAGFAWFGPAAQLDAKTLDRLFAANVQAPYLLASVLAPKMVARGDGVIINLASRAGTMGQPDSAAYGATKAAMASLARSWAAEYGPAGIRVNAVSPGPVYTNAAGRELFDASAKTTALGRAAEPQEVADLDRIPGVPARVLCHRREHCHRRRSRRPPRPRGPCPPLTPKAHPTHQITRGIPMTQTAEQLKALVLDAFDTLFNKRDYAAAERFWSPNYIQHSAHIEPGREGLFELVKASPPDMHYENALIVANGDYVMLHGRFSNIGQPANWIVADIVRIENGLLAEHWDVIQDEATREESRSGLPMFKAEFPS